MSRELRQRHLATANQKRWAAGLQAPRNAGRGGGCHRAGAAAAVVAGADRPLPNVTGEGLGVGWEVSVAGGRRIEGRKMETGISHSEYKCQPIPVIRTFKSEVSSQTRIKIKRWPPRARPVLATRFLEVNGTYFFCQLLGT